MRMISIDDIADGMVLGKSVYGYNNKLMLSAGFRLSTDMKSKLFDKGYHHIYIMEEGTDDVVPEDIISDEIKMHARTKIADKADKIQNYFKFKELSKKKMMNLLQSGYMKKINLTVDMKNVVMEILNDISSAGAKFLTSPLFKSESTYYLDHAINTTVLAILVGKKYGFSKNELLDLALGTFLHDFGKIVLEKMKGAKNDEVVDDLLREHPSFGYLIVHHSHNASPIVCQIINQHHESQDGSGYPIGLRGDNLPPISTIKRETKGRIYRLAEICTVVDAYDNLVLNPLNDKKMPPEDAIKELVLKSGTIYNSDIVNTLTKIIPYFPVGAMVRITDVFDKSLIGYRGVVAKTNELHINRPLIILLFDTYMRRIKPRALDTSKLRHIELELML